MIKLSLFMLDPVDAHAKYREEIRQIKIRCEEQSREEIEHLRIKLKRKEKELEGMKRGFKKVQAKNYQQQQQLKAALKENS